MTGDVLELADKLWSGEVDIASDHPIGAVLSSGEKGWFGQLVEVRPDVAFVPSFANVSAFRTDDGLLLVDTGSLLVAEAVHRAVRGWSTARLDTAVFSHGHIDHVFGVKVFEEESARKGWRAPKVVAHRAMPARFDRYVLTAGYNAVINQRQFQVPNLQWPINYRYPDETYEERLEVEVGGTLFELHHAKGETDDHTWTWVPEHRVLCCGDLFIWASPNAGNPQKVQRYPREWAAALRQMQSLEPEVLLPGHGFPIVGAERVHQALGDTAELLEHLVNSTIGLMNEGARLDDIIHSVKAPPHLLERPYLRPIYDEPEFIVRNIWRLYGGWYDGNPAHLKPAPHALLAAELADLAGGAARLAQRALELIETPNPDPELAFRLAGHLAELAAAASPRDASVQRTRQKVFAALAHRATSTMAKGVFAWAAHESSHLG